jgi:small subunit ribosomal protein S6
LADIVYEGMFILDANLYARDPDGVSGQISAMIQETGGEILVSRFWEERRLAYPIQGHRKGVYWLTYFRIKSERLIEIQRRCQLTESVLRFLFLKVDARIVDALVNHARVGTIQTYNVPDPKQDQMRPPRKSDRVPVAVADELDDDKPSVDDEP